MLSNNAKKIGSTQYGRKIVYCGTERARGRRFISRSSGALEYSIADGMLPTLSGTKFIKHHSYHISSGEILWHGESERSTVQ